MLKRDIEKQLSIIERMFDDEDMDFVETSTWEGRIDGNKAQVKYYKDRKGNNCFDFEFLERSYPYKDLTQILFNRGGGEKGLSSGSIGLLFFDDEGFKVMYEAHCDLDNRRWTSWTFTKIGIYANRKK